MDHFEVQTLPLQLMVVEAPVQEGKINVITYICHGKYNILNYATYCDIPLDMLDSNLG
jgi:hypothetical protein